MKTKIIWSVIVVVAVVAAFFLGKVVANTPQLAGAIGNNYIERYVSEILYNGGYNSQLPIQTSSTITGVGFTNTGDMTISGGTLNITTSNTATSTVVVGCVQTTATSTATPIKFLISSAASTTPTFGSASDVAIGGVSWGYGTCPNL